MKKLSVILSVILIVCMLTGCVAKEASENETIPPSSSNSEQSTADNSETEPLSNGETTVDNHNSVKPTEKTTEKKQNIETTRKTVNTATTTKKAVTTTKPHTTVTTTKPSTTLNTAKYTTEEIYCKNGNLNIYGKMYKPNKSGKIPVVIMSHSFGLTSAALVPYAKLMAENGYCAYIFDFCGGSFTTNKSDGSKDDMTVFTEVADLEAVLSKIRGLSYVDKNNVFLFGTSQGGLVSALVANNHNSQLKGMILLYPGFNMNEAVKNGASMAGGILSQKYINAIKDYDIYGNIGGFTKDVLIIHGTADGQQTMGGMGVPIKYSERAVEIYKSAKLVRIKGANHGFNSANNFGMGGNYDKEVNPHILDFMESHT